jgi:hypothetical protein
MSAAAAMETLEPVYVGSREAEMAEALKLLSQASAKLSATAGSFADGLDAS